jgi:hypothetical protein
MLQWQNCNLSNQKDQKEEDLKTHRPERGIKMEEGGASWYAQTIGLVVVALLMLAAAPFLLTH